MHDMTAANLRSAHGGESMAHMRYKIWADAAQKDGFPNVARLFTAVSHAEHVHSWNHFSRLRVAAGDHPVLAGAGFGLAGTSENLAGAIGGENFEVTEMYPAYIAVAEAQGENGAAQSMKFAFEAEKVHLAMYNKAKDAVDAGKDLEIGTIQICDMCGHTLEGDAPDKCPVCGASKDKFIAF